jgi:putative chitinase
MGNGDSDSGDGFRFRGRGLIQLTGKNNYTACGEALGMDLVENSDYLATPEGAARSAAWFFQQNGCNEVADTDDVVRCTKIINGGTIGLEERTHLFEKAKSVLGA